MEVIYGVYAESHDITFIMKDIVNDKENIESTEILGFCYGNEAENEEVIKEYIGKLKAEFITNEKIDMEKLKHYLEEEKIIEFNSDKECLEYFNTYDYQDFKSIEEMKKYQDRFGFNIGKKRYHINYDDALDVIISPK